MYKRAIPISGRRQAIGANRFGRRRANYFISKSLARRTFLPNQGRQEVYRQVQTINSYESWSNEITRSTFRRRIPRLVSQISSRAIPSIPRLQGRPERTRKPLL